MNLPTLDILYKWNTEAEEREIKKSISFIIAQKENKIIKYLGINLTKEVKDLYSESYETLMKEIKDNAEKWKDISCSWIGRTNIV